MTCRSLAMLLILFLASALPARADDPAAVARAFYDSYTKASNAERFDRVAFTRSQEARLEPDLYATLLNIMAKGPEDGVWLDFDPYANAQMNVATLSLGPATVKDGLASVWMSASYRSPGPERPAVKLVLRPGGPEGWRIANFLYPGDDGLPSWDLRSWLKKQLEK
ncbi:MAG: DUF3828 domain-containing protein [Armatimonadetes bacterium]|nr:DUF3828 domain-containing protein [Armatimonadota bacterium]